MPKCYVCGKNCRDRACASCAARGAAAPATPISAEVIFEEFAQGADPSTEVEADTDEIADAETPAGAAKPRDPSDAPTGELDVEEPAAGAGAPAGSYAEAASALDDLFGAAAPPAATRPAAVSPAASPAKPAGSYEAEAASALDGLFGDAGPPAEPRPAAVSPVASAAKPAGNFAIEAASALDLVFSEAGQPAEPPLVAVPPAVPTSAASLQRWNSVLDESPVFDGHGPFEVKTPAAPLPRSLDVAIGVRFGVASAPADAESVVPMMVTLTPSGAPLMQGRDGPVAHVILALDLSGSMNAAGKYPLLTRALSGMFRELRAHWYHEVLVSIVAFAWGAETIVCAEPASKLDEREVLRRLDGWKGRFTRYTDFAGGLREAGRIARDSVRACSAMPVRIYAMTDGKVQDMPHARNVMSKLAAGPVDVHGLAFGDDADIDALTQLIAGGRGGTVKHIRSETIEEAFGRIGDVAQQVVANRALLEVELQGGVIGGDAFRYRPARHRYPKGAFVRGTRFAADLGTLETGRAYSLLFHLRVRPVASGAGEDVPEESHVAKISLRVPGSGGSRTFEAVATLPRHAGTATADPDPEVEAACDVLNALESGDPAATLRALRVRREIYLAERRDAHVLWVLDKAILELEKRGSLAGLSDSEHATLVSHTVTLHSASGAAAAEAVRDHVAAGTPGGA